MTAQIKARVWSTRGARDTRRTWHYAVCRPDGQVVLYDNTGSFEPILKAALIRVEALRHMVVAGHKLPRYKGDLS